MDNLVKEIKKSKKLQTFTRKSDTYKYMNVKDYQDLKPLTYTILLEDTNVITKINGKIESKQKLQRGDYVLCGRNKEMYGHKIEKILNLFDLGNIKNKIVKRKGFKLTKKNIKNLDFERNRIVITPSWGGKQYLSENDYILLELKDTPNTSFSNYYGIENSAFKKTYK